MPSNIFFHREMSSLKVIDAAVQLNTETRNEKDGQAHVPILLQVARAKVPKHGESPFQDEAFLKVFKGGWQSDIDMDCRRTILVEISKLFWKQNVGASKKKIMGLAKRLEEQLYMKSSSLKRYKDLDSLESRVKKLATKNCARDSRKKNK